MVPPPLHYRVPTRGRNCYVTPSFLGVHRQGAQIRKGCLTCAFSGAHKRAEVLHNPCILGGPQQRKQNQNGCLTLAFSGAHRRAEVLCHPCILGHPQTKGDKIRSGCLTPAFSGAQKKAEWLRNSCVLGGPKNKGTKSEVKTYARGNNYARSISKHGSPLRRDAQIFAQCALSAPPKRSPVGHRSKKMPGALTLPVGCTGIYTGQP